MRAPSGEIVGRSRFYGTATANASGVATLSFGPPRVGTYWDITRLAIKGNSVLRPVATVYVGIVDDAHQEDRSQSGNGDIADELQPVKLDPSSTLYVVWTGATPGAIFTARGSYNIVSA